MRQKAASSLTLQQCRAAQVNPGGFTTPARRPSVPHRTAGCGKSSLRPLMAGSSPSLPDGSNPSAAIVQSASDVQCSRLLKTTNSQKGCYRRFDLQPIG
ncbi:transposase (plasmid) [Enterobacteriaceae bacterium ENNIH3]|nr:transposase [Enterobacteriaceae bacterium ENNIH3]